MPRKNDPKSDPAKKSVRLTHREVFEWLLQEERHEALLAELRRQLAGNRRLDVPRAEVVEATPIPFVIMDLVKPEQEGAFCSAIFLDLGPLHAPRLDPDFYFPIVTLWRPTQLQVNHAYRNLLDSLDLCARLPTYPVLVRRLSLSRITRAAQIKESVDFEVFRLFELEPRALREDYAAGDKEILGPRFPTMQQVYPAQSADEFARLKIAGEILSMDRRFLDRFPGEGERVRKAIRTATNRHGRALFGADAYASAQEMHEKMGKNMMIRMLDRPGPRRANGGSNDGAAPATEPEAAAQPQAG